MPRLIDADALPKFTGYVFSACEVAKAVENAPTVDAVPVVRCKDCKWFRFNKTAIWCDNERGLVEPRCDSFCSWGERKDE